MKTEFAYGDECDRPPYHYTLCGLDDIYLVSGYELTTTPYGEGVVVHNMDGLHQAIGEHLAESKKELSPKELRFLRHEMDLTQAELGDLLRVADQTVARWEKGETVIPGPADMMVRAFYLEHVHKQLPLRELAKCLREIDEPAVPEKQIFKSTEEGWQLAA
jgi:DNA-binding transcriptional regulator YiaG